MSKPMMDACRPIQVPPTAKAVLMVFAYQHHDGGELWPSLAFLEESTCLSRRAVIDAIKTLEACALVAVDRSNPRRNVYSIKPGEFQADKIPPSVRAQRRNDSAPATPLDSAADTPASDTESAPADAATGAASALGAVNVPHQQEGADSAPAAADGEPAAPGVVHLPPQVVHLPHTLVNLPHPNSKEQLSSNTLKEGVGAGAEIFQLDGSDGQETDKQGKKAKGKKPKATDSDPNTVPLPDCISRELFVRWVTDLKHRNKSPTPETIRLHIVALGQYHAEGQDLQAVIDHSIASQYRKPFPPPTPKFQARRAGGAPHTGFSTVDYEKDLTDGRPPA